MLRKLLDDIRETFNAKGATHPLMLSGDIYLLTLFSIDRLTSRSPKGSFWDTIEISLSTSPGPPFFRIPHSKHSIRRRYREAVYMCQFQKQKKNTILALIQSLDSECPQCPVWPSFGEMAGGMRIPVPIYLNEPGHDRAISGFGVAVYERVFTG
jgi:hypothetical protein